MPTLTATGTVTSSGSEGGEAAIKFVHAYTGCGHLVFANVEFHGGIAS